MADKRETGSAASIRNVFRPFYNAHRFQRGRYRSKARPFYWKELQKVRRETPLTDLGLLCQIAEENPAYPFPGLGNTFPSQASHIPNARFRFLTPVSLARETALAVARLNHHSDRLCDALTSLNEINRSVSVGRWSVAEHQILSHKEKFGYSFAVLKKELYQGSEELTLTMMTRRYSAVVKGLDRKPYTVLAHFVYDLADQTHEPADASRRWMTIARRANSGASWVTEVLAAELSSPTSDERLAEALLRYSSMSLLDLALFFWRTRNARDSDLIQTAFLSLSVRLRDCLISFFSSAKLSIHPRYIRQQDGPSDSEVYRASFFFSEFADISMWRSEVNSIIYHSPSRDSGLFYSFMKRNGLNGIRDSSLHHELSIIEIPNPAVFQASLFPTLLGAVYLRSLKGPTDDEIRRALDILSDITNLHLYIIANDILGLRSTEQNGINALLNFFLSELLFRKERSLDNELERRSDFMEMFPDRRKDSIYDLIVEIAEWSEPVALFISRICSRSFLERLFLIMKSLVEVIEVRLQLCRWMVDHDAANRERLIEESEALLRELATIDTRSDLDSTRVHVDEESLREWFHLTQASAVNRYVQSVLAEGPHPLNPSMLAFYTMLTKEKEADGDLVLVDSGVGSEASFLALFEATLDTFKGDRFFGLNSYLSRRIRHGTLAGHLITPVNRVLKRMEEEIEVSNNIRSALKGWVLEFQKLIDHARKHVIQLRSSTNSEGLIQGTWKNVANVTHLDATMSRVRQRVYETRGTSDFFVDIHALCWDCIESDLAQLRLYVVRTFYPQVQAELIRQIGQLGISDQKVVSPYAREILHILQVRFQEVCGWFIRPVFRRNEYDLRMLITSTFSIVKELDDTYLFDSRVEMTDEISINRGAFELIGDALFILVGNAAKHGLANGMISIEARKSAGDSSLLEMSIKSACQDRAHFLEGLSKINKALRSTDSRAIDIAAIEEGFSGLGKLVGQLRRVKSSDVRLAYEYEERHLSIRFYVSMPTIVLFQGERT